MTKFLALYDIHHGRDIRRGHGGTAHDPRLLEAVLKFSSDFKPGLIVLGGDQLNCGPISHWLKDKRRSQEGGRWSTEVKAFDKEFLKPLEGTLAPRAERAWLEGNHEDWVEDLLDKNPELDDEDGSLIHHREILRLRQRGWQYYPQGGVFRKGYLHFIHGDTIGGGQHIAKQAVEKYGRNVRVGHHHTYQVYTSVAAADETDRKTGIAVPCLGHLNPAFMENAPSRWIQGFLYGYIQDNGIFNDYVVIATKGSFVVDGKVYRG